MYSNRNLVPIAQCCRAAIAAIMAATLLIGCESKNANATPCSAQSDCGSEEYCADSGYCEKRTDGGCRLDGECPPGQECLASGDCQPIDPQERCEWSVETWSEKTVFEVEKEILFSSSIGVADDNSVAFCVSSASGESNIEWHVRVGVGRGAAVEAVEVEAPEAWSLPVCVAVLADAEHHRSLVADHAVLYTVAQDGSPPVEVFLDGSELPPGIEFDFDTRGHVAVGAAASALMLTVENLVLLYPEVNGDFYLAWHGWRVEQYLRGERGVPLVDVIHTDRPAPLWSEPVFAVLGDTAFQSRLYWRTSTPSGSDPPPFDNEIASGGRLLHAWTHDDAPEFLVLLGNDLLRTVRTAQDVWSEETVAADFFDDAYAGPRFAQSMMRLVDHTYLADASQPLLLLADSRETPSGETELSAVKVVYDNHGEWATAVPYHRTDGAQISDPTAVNVGCGRPGIYFSEQRPPDGEGTPGGFAILYIESR